MQQNIKIGTMNLPKEFKKYCALRKLKTLEVLLLHPRIAQDYEKKKTQDEIVAFHIRLIKAIQEDDEKVFQEYDTPISNMLKHIIVCIAEKQNEETINEIFQKKYQLKIPRIIRFILQDGLKKEYIVSYGVQNETYLFVGTLIGYIETMEDSRKKFALKEYFKGKTLRQIARETGFTVQYFSSILKSVRPDKIILLESDYAKVLSLTKITKEAFYRVFPDELPHVYIGAKMLARYKRTHPVPFLSLLKRDDIAIRVRLQIQMYAQKNQKLITMENGDLVEIKNDKLFQYVLSNLEEGKEYSPLEIRKMYLALVKKAKTVRASFEPYNAQYIYIKTYNCKQLLPTKRGLVVYVPEKPRKEDSCGTAK